MPRRHPHRHGRYAYGYAYPYAINTPVVVRQPIVVRKEYSRLSKNQSSILVIAISSIIIGALLAAMLLRK